MSWRSDELETRCGRESHHPAEGALGTTSEFGDQTSWWEDAGMRTCPKEVGPPAPGLAAMENENDTRQCPEELGRSICCSLCSVSNSLSHTQPFQIKWEVYFFKEVFARLYYCVKMYPACIYVYVYSYSIWLYNRSILSNHWIHTKKTCGSILSFLE